MQNTQIRQSRFSGLTDIIDYYAWRLHDGYSLSNEQRSQLKETIHSISVFGEEAQPWVQMGKEILMTN